MFLKMIFFQKTKTKIDIRKIGIKISEINEKSEDIHNSFFFVHFVFQKCVFSVKDEYCGIYHIYNKKCVISFSEKKELEI